MFENAFCCVQCATLINMFLFRTRAFLFGPKGKERRVVSVEESNSNFNKTAKLQSKSAFSKVIFLTLR